MSEEKNNNKSWWEEYGIFIIILLSVVIIAFLIVESIKQRKKESKEESKERFKLLLNRKKRLEGLVSKRIHLKRRLDRTFKIIYLISRIFLISFIALCFYSARWYYDEPLVLENYLTWGALLGIIFTGIMYLIFGSPTSMIEAIKEVKPKLQTRIYGKFIEVDDKIRDNKEEINQLKSQIKNSKH